MKQISFFKKQKTYFGGSLSNGKIARTLSLKKPIHLVLKSQNNISLFTNRRFLTQLIKKQAKTFGIKIYDLTVQADHIHLCLKIHNRVLYRGFIRAFTGIAARRLGKGLWKSLPFTRVLSWGQDFINLKEYFLRNKLEVVGIVPYSERRYRYIK